MRERLAALHGRGARFRATFGRYGRGFRPTRSGDEVLTVLLLDVCNEQGELLCGHVWVNEAWQFLTAEARPGDGVEFGAKVIAYRRGFIRGRRIKKRYKFRQSNPDHFPRDYALHQITRVHRVSREEDVS